MVRPLPLEWLNLFIRPVVETCDIIHCQIELRCYIHKAFLLIKS